MSKRKWTDEQFIEAVKNSLSYAEVLRKLGLKAAGSNYDTVKKKNFRIKFRYLTHDWTSLELGRKI